MFERLPLVLGHRGASAHAPENTLEAFRVARDHGADGVEFDARRTADGGWVVAHDASLPGIGPIVGHSTASIRERFQNVPTVAEALAATAGLAVNLEIKNSPFDPDWDPDAGSVDGLMGLLAGHDGPVLVSSFHLGTVDRIRTLPGAPATGWLIGTTVDPVPALVEAAARGHAALHPERSLLPPGRDAELAAAAAALGLRLVTWTVDDPAEARRLAAAGVAVVITNDPGAIRAALDG